MSSRGQGRGFCARRLGTNHPWPLLNQGGEWLPSERVATVSVFLTVVFSPWVFEPTVNSNYDLTVATTNAPELRGKKFRRDGQPDAMLSIT
jgi:hypothetical protein